MRRCLRPCCWTGLALVLALAGCVVAPTEFREPPPLRAPAQADLNRQVFDRVWSLVDTRYFDAGLHGVNWRAARERYRPRAAAAKDATALYAVLNEMCLELKDSHLVAMDPRRAHEFNTEHRAAVGFRFQLSEGQRVVTDVVPGSPAAEAGIQRGWIVLTRNGAPIRDDERFIGRLGQPVRLELRDHAGQVRAFTLLPRLLDFERHESRRLADGVVYVRFDRFDLGEAAWLNRELKAAADAPGVILDLRQNGGGRTFALAIAVAAFFPRRVAEGTMVERDHRAVEKRSLPWRAARYSGPLVVLVGPYTASAAEILAHVLQHHHRALLVGRRTAGAVVQAVFEDLPDGGQLELPITDYLGLDGQRLEGRGLTPDLVVAPATFADLRAARDPELAAAAAARSRAPTLRPAR